MNRMQLTRRDFLGRSVVAGTGIAAGLGAATLGGVARAASSTGKPPPIVSLTDGPDRADNAFRACQFFKKQIAAAIGTKRVVIKVNFVWYPGALPCTYAAHVEGILEFLKSIGKRDVVIAECSATNSAFGAYDYMGYWYLTKRYPVKLTDLNEEGYANVKIWASGSRSDSTLVPIRVSKMLMNPDNFIISAAPMKTHNTVVVTLSTKNVAMGAPLIDIGAKWSQAGNHGDKSTMHGSLGAPSGTGSGYDYQVLNDNVYRLAKVYGIRPDLAVIDGYCGMEGNGPVSGTALASPQMIALASLDHLAADRVGLELMGSNVKVLLGSTGQYFPACLNYLGQAGLGQWDYSKITVLGESVSNHIDNYAANPYQTAGYETANIAPTPRD